jgi:hypothetical protein
MRIEVHVASADGPPHLSQAPNPSILQAARLPPGTKRDCAGAEQRAAAEGCGARADGITEAPCEKEAHNLPQPHTMYQDRPLTHRTSSGTDLVGSAHCSRTPFSSDELQVGAGAASEGASTRKGWGRLGQGARRVSQESVATGWGKVREEYLKNPSPQKEFQESVATENFLNVVHAATAQQTAQKVCVSVSMSVSWLCARSDVTPALPPSLPPLPPHSLSLRWGTKKLKVRTVSNWRRGRS